MTTSKSNANAVSRDLLDRDFTAVAPHRVWVTDFTEVRTWGYLRRVHPRLFRPVHVARDTSTSLMDVP